MPEVAFESDPKREQGIHIECNVRNGPVQKGGRKQTPDLPGTDQFIRFDEEQSRDVILSKRLGGKL